MNWFTLIYDGGFQERLREIFASSYQVILGLGGPGLFLLAFLDSSFLSIPGGNDLLVILLSAGQGWSQMIYYACMTTMGSVIGCSLLYFLGTRGGGFVERRMHRREIKRLHRLYQSRGALALIIPAILPPPTPFKVFVLAAGVFQVPFHKFVFSVFVGRGLRYLMWGTLAVLYEEGAQYLLKDRFYIVGIGLSVLFLAVLAWFLIRDTSRDTGEVD
jgi:membrane protein YqaA with SNARE-associated domain